MFILPGPMADVLDLDLKDDAIRYRQIAYEKYNVTKTTHLPSDVSKELNRLFDLAIKEYHRQRNYQVAIRLYDERINGSSEVLPEGRDDTQYQWLDDFPEPETVDGDILSVDRVSLCKVSYPPSLLISVPLPKQFVVDRKWFSQCSCYWSHGRR